MAAPDRGPAATVPTLPRRRLLALGATLALLAGCSPDGDSGGAPDQTDPDLDAPAGTATSSPHPDDDTDPETLGQDDPAQDPDVAVDELTFATCEGEGFTIGYPETWSAADAEDGRPCGVFGPGELAPVSSSDLSVPVQVHVDPDTAFEDRPGPTDAELDRQELTVGGNDAVRATALAPGDGGEPEGVEVTTYHVDLGEQGLLTATTSDLGDTDYARDQAILDRMMDELTIG